MKNDKSKIPDEAVFRPIEPIEPIEQDDLLVTEHHPQPEPAEPEKDSKNGITLIGTTAVLAIIVIMVIAFIQVQKTRERQNEARTRLAMGQASLIDGDSYRALFQFTVALELDPDIPGAYSSLGRIAIENKQGSDAVKKFLAELEITPDDRESHLALGCLYNLGCISPGDPNNLKVYLVGRFADVLPYNWPLDLQFDVDGDTDALSSAVYHFQYALEKLPDDPTPELGLALNHIANYDLGTARQRLSRLISETSDDAIISIAQNVIEDINREEQYMNWIASDPRYSGSADTGSSLLGPGAGESAPEIPVPPQPADYSDDLQPLPGFDDQPGFNYDSFTTGYPEDSGFGSRAIDQSQAAGNTGSDLGMEIQLSDLTLQPTVKPITNDIHIQDTNEWVRTVRIGNIYEAGTVGFREGETIVMPKTNTEVTVIESSDDRIVLEERGHRFVWVPGEVGWVQETPEDAIGTNPDFPPGVHAYTPGEEDGDDVESEDGDDSTEDELGPLVESG